MRPFDFVPDFEAVRSLALTNLDAAASQLALVAGVSSSTQVRIYYGPPGTGKTLAAVQQAVMLADPGFEGQTDFSRCFLRMNELREQICFITFHPSLQYEDVVESIRPHLAPDIVDADDQARLDPGDEGDADSPRQARTDGRLRYVHYEGALMRMVRSAIKNQQQQYVVVIDEINRGDVSRILGPLISALEPDKRMGADFPIGFESQYPLVPESDSRIFLPSNLHVLGTMNSADRNIALVDYALRRRFEFVECPPVESVLSQTTDTEPIDLKRLLATINSRISYLLDADHRIGHGYFMRVRTNSEAVEVFARRLLPLLDEYFYGSEAILPLIVGDRIGGPANVFQIRSREAAFSSVFGISEEDARALGVNPQRSQLDLKIDPRFWNPDRVPPGPDDDAFASAALRKIYSAGAASVVTEGMSETDSPTEVPPVNPEGSESELPESTLVRDEAED